MDLGGGHHVRLILWVRKSPAGKPLITSTYRECAISRVGCQYRRLRMARGITESDVHTAAAELRASAQPSSESGHSWGRLAEHSDSLAGNLVEPTRHAPAARAPGP